MNIVKEITVFLENQPGTLGRVAGTLGARGISILGFTLNNELDYGALRMIVDDPSGALHLFGEHNLVALDHDVLELRLKNDAGALSRLAESLSGANVNVEYAYGSAGTQAGAATTLYVRVSDTEKAREVLEGLEEVE